MVSKLPLVTIALLALLAAALPPAPASSTQDLLPPPDAWRAAATTGAPLSLRIAGVDLVLDVRLNDELFAPGFAAVGFDGEALDTSDVLILDGTLRGERAGWARITVGDGVRGHILSERAGFLTLGQDRDGRAMALDASEMRGLIPAGVNTVIEDEDTQFAESCDSLAWQPQLASPVGLVTGWSLRTFQNALAVDRSYQIHAGPAWQEQALATMAAVDALYRAEFGIGLEIVHFAAIDDALIPGTTTDVILDTLQDHYVATYPNVARENVHLLTGRDTTNAAGQVNCVGSAGRTTVSYSVASVISGGPYEFVPGVILLDDVAFKVSAHEMAHTLSAHHHYANCVESARAFSPFEPLDVCTVMINDWGLIGPSFSTAERLTARGWMEFYEL